MELDIERVYFEDKKYSFFSGCDEVGRGPLAGPVVGATVTFFPHLLEKSAKVQEVEKILAPFLELGVGDSKSLTEKKRISILKCLGIEVSQLRPGKSLLFKGKGLEAFSYSIEEVSPLDIDKINIFQASLMAMKKSFLRSLNLKNEALTEFVNKSGRGVLFVDGKYPPKGIDSIACVEPVIKGDSKVVLIAIASILAKEYRDHLMRTFDKEYPGYGLAKHKGYPTKAHYEALEKIGPSIIHRKTFKGVKEFYENL
ncbi:MAG: ribonuclease HII [Halobacteriovoraceae bacterium]|nr:ribonuclease HII [Halobacteriovoraceae bacterium]|tara:strand:- start:239 stop:1003 length:765 start_codon:yes stop_codon:yes gene_type:complete